MEEGAFSGYASTFGGPPDSYGDVVEPDAFTETLNEWKRAGGLPQMLLQHDMGSTVDCSLPIGSWTHMSTDSKGLHVEGKFAKTQRGQDVLALMKMQPPAISKMSIGYKTRKAVYMPKSSDIRRKLLNVQLFEVSLVGTPANPRATVDSVRSADAGDKFMQALARLALQ
jgi:HK97 family phage prohead protease